MSRPRHLACIVGWPVARSPSPAMHNAAFQALALEWRYVPLAVRPGAIEEGVGLLRSLLVEGANVTIPHKEAIVPFLDAVEGDAAVFRAVNTLVREGGRLVGDNTDGAGFIRFLRLDAGFDPAGARAVVLGAGGAARAVAIALRREGAAVTLTARRREQAEAVAALGAGVAVAGWGDPVAADLAVNATPARAGLPLGAVLAGAAVAVDLGYLAPETEFLAAAREADARAFDGLGMLVHQAALSFERWTGREAPLAVMREAAAEALAGAGHRDKGGASGRRHP